jgi:hypothetical protein
MHLAETNKHDRCQFLNFNFPFAIQREVVISEYYTCSYRNIIKIDTNRDHFAY